MLQLLQPLWLTAMAGIAFPVLLHLWNDRRGKVLPVGSIALLERRSPRQAWSRRLSEWWLLLLRCLLLMALALLLAGPSWKRMHAGAGRKGWILEEGGAGSAARAEVERLYMPMIDSLLRVGYERHDWGMEATTAADEGKGSYWDAFRAVDRMAPVGAPFYIFSSALVSRFRGTRPHTERPVHWYTYTPADSVSHWIGGAWLVSPDSVRIAEGHSRPTGSTYSYLMEAAGRLSVSVDSQPAVRVDTAALNIVIYTEPEYMHDSRYLAAAFRALERFGRGRLRIGITGSLAGRALGKRDWLYWLSPRPLPSGLLAGHVVRYEPVAEKADRYEAVWKGGYGRTLLGRERTDHRIVYHFFSRFDPGWNGLVWSRSFPALLEELLEDGQDRPAGRDRRVLDPEQIVPVQVSGAGREAGVGEIGSAEAGSGERVVRETVDLKPIIWGIVFFLFFLERIKAYSNGSRKA